MRSHTTHIKIVFTLYAILYDSEHTSNMSHVIPKQMFNGDRGEEGNMAPIFILNNFVYN